jgi:hypothetical protein
MLEGILLVDIATEGREVDDPRGARLDPDTASPIEDKIGILEPGEVRGDVDRQAPKTGIAQSGFHLECLGHRPSAKERRGELEHRVR